MAFRKGAALTAIDWDEIGTLRSAVGAYDIRTDPLWILLITAHQGHEGLIEGMHITMSRGAVFNPSDIEELARHPNRKRS